MFNCDCCADFGLRFARLYEPHEFIEGDPRSSIWIVGLNPKEDGDWSDPRGKEGLRNYFQDPTRVSPYFKQFGVVSGRLFDLLGKEGGAAHTDLVKCSSHSWPPKNVKKADRATIIRKCVAYLDMQIQTHQPRVIVCNGSEVSAEMRRLLPPPDDTPSEATRYIYKWPLGNDVTIVLSGFIGRLDNYAKRRLGAEIDALLPSPNRDAVWDPALHPTCYRRPSPASQGGELKGQRTL